MEIVHFHLFPLHCWPLYKH